MTRQKTKESTPISFRMESGLLSDLDEYSKQTMIPKTRIMEQALREYLERMTPTKES